jgi:hypothetical protein
MKKLLLMGVIAAAAVTSASAQVSFGPRVGVNFANQTKEFDDEKDPKSKTGLLLGVAANFAMNDLISIQPELLYSQQGAKAAEGSGTFHANYINLPILVKATFGDGDTKFFANVGPQVGYWMGGKFKSDAGEEDIKFEDDEDGNGYNRLDVGLLAGIGVGRQVGSGMMTVDLRYGLGLSNINKYKEDLPSDMNKQSNRVLSLSLSYMFGGE